MKKSCRIYVVTGCLSQSVQCLFILSCSVFQLSIFGHGHRLDTHPSITRFHSAASWAHRVVALLPVPRHNILTSVRFHPISTSRGRASGLTLPFTSTPCPCHAVEAGQELQARTNGTFCYGVHLVAHNTAGRSLGAYRYGEKRWRSARKTGGRGVAI
ncbi:hypothetical protein GE09DRAFT_1097340 [Coniochaeta sp. 2T2.1]|nr:hypothetical protein GE09DRAFT_1097340 [Coniochaeta sp. 2T2.1]